MKNMTMETFQLMVGQNGPLAVEALQRYNLFDELVLRLRQTASDARAGNDLCYCATSQHGRPEVHTKLCQRTRILIRKASQSAANAQKR